MKLNIQKGVFARPQRIVIYAPEGLGKSTLSSQLPNPLFLDFEKGTHHLDVSRLEPKTSKEVDEILSSLAKDNQGFQTLVVDTVDWLEELAIVDLCQQHKKNGLEDFGYGKGYVFLAEKFSGILNALNDCAKTMNVVLLAHSHVRKFELPDGAGAFDRYELKLSKQVGPLVREWCDALLFGNWKTRIRERDDGPVTTFKGSGGKERILYCGHSATADAKNRRGLKDEEAWSLETLTKCLGQISTVSHGAQGEPATGSVQPQKQELSPAPTSAVGQSSEASAAKAAEPVKPSIDLSPPTPAEDQIPIVEHPLASIIGKYELQVNLYLQARKVVPIGKTYLDVPASYIERVKKNPEGFMAQALKEVFA